MDLGVVLPCLAEDIDNLSAWIFEIIDREAQKRATSVYLVDRVVPMLPEHLCNGICSLRPNEDKLAISVIFHMDDFPLLYPSPPQAYG